MAFLRREDVLQAALDERVQTRKSADQILREARDTSRDRFDIFLSHSTIDRDLVVGAKRLIEKRGFTVYVDWIDDPQLDRTAVTARTADSLRVRMRQCGSLFYAHTPNAALSRWCPWELGYFDALDTDRCRVHVLPIVRAGESYAGQEYLDLYETVDLASWRRPPPRDVGGGVDHELRRRILGDALGFRTPRGPML
jgi:hypothetical protein